MMADVVEIFPDGKIIERDFTEAELAQIELDKIANAEYEAKVQAKAAQRQALLSRLGITEEEARILLGGN